jgi:YD repeat-containing protein
MFILLKKSQTKILKTILLCGACVGGLYASFANAGDTKYQYDALGRVIKVTYPDTKQICYYYDAAGNRIQVNRRATGTCTPTGSTLTSSLVAQTNETQVVDDTLTASDNQTASDSATSESAAPSN